MALLQFPVLSYSTVETMTVELRASPGMRVNCCCVFLCSIDSHPNVYVLRMVAPLHYIAI